MGRDLTARQADIARLIGEHVLDTGVVPTMRDLGAVAGIASTNGTREILLALERKGALRLAGNGRARSYVLLDGAPGMRAFQVALHSDGERYDVTAFGLSAAHAAVLAERSLRSMDVLCLPCTGCTVEEVKP